MENHVRRWWPAAAIAAWLGLLGCGFVFVLDEQVRAGAPASAPARWPARSRIPSDASRPTLLVFAHPRCACTHATLRDLERLVARARGQARILVVLALPEGAPAGWSRSAIALEAGAIPGVTVLVDPDEVESRRFGVHTSGQALLYDRSGRLRFAGGLTPGRAHEGDNAGCDAIVADLASGTSATSATAVFGCALSTPVPSPENPR